MKRLHIHIKVDDLEKAVPFYEAMLGQSPTKLESDYAKWLLDDPSANISLSTHGGSAGIDHVGLQFDDDATMEETANRLINANGHIMPEKNTTCCYAHSNKYWARDTNGALWELFHTTGDATLYGKEPDRPSTPQ